MFITTISFRSGGSGRRISSTATAAVSDYGPVGTFYEHLFFFLDGILEPLCSILLVGYFVARSSRESRTVRLWYIFCRITGCAVDGAWGDHPCIPIYCRRWGEDEEKIQKSQRINEGKREGRAGAPVVVSNLFISFNPLISRFLGCEWNSACCSANNSIEKTSSASWLVFPTSSFILSFLFFCPSFSFLAISSNVSFSTSCRQFF